MTEQDNAADALVAALDAPHEEVSSPGPAADLRRWALWFSQCADEADDLPDGERAGLRIAADHLRDGHTAQLVAGINLGPTEVEAAKPIADARELDVAWRAVARCMGTDAEVHPSRSREFAQYVAENVLATLATTTEEAR